MIDVLPAQAGLVVNGMFYRYTIEKDPNSDALVIIKNENAQGDGNILENVDDWSQLPGSTINDSILFGDIPKEYFGTGSITVEGDGTITEADIRYSYKFDECYNPLTSSNCPGYDEALLQLLESLGLDGETVILDPLDDEAVRLTLERETEDEEEEAPDNNEKEEEEDDPIEGLNADVDIDGFIDGANQNAIMNTFATIPNFDAYYATSIQGGVYEDVLVLEDADLPDNRRALSNLAQDNVHRNMVRSQYE